MQIKGKLSTIFFKGFLFLLPLYLTIYFLYWLITGIESNFSQWLKPILGAWYLPGFGIIGALLFIFLVGFLLQLYFLQHIREGVNQLLIRIPILGEIYEAISSLVYYLTQAKPQGEKVVMVKFKQWDIELLGLVTRSDFEEAPKGIELEEDTIAVYLPMSYQIGGYTVYIPRANVRPVEMSRKDALKWTFVAGIENSNGKKN